MLVKIQLKKVAFVFFNISGSQIQLKKVAFVFFSGLPTTSYAHIFDVSGKPMCVCVVHLHACVMEIQVIQPAFAAISTKWHLLGILY